MQIITRANLLAVLTGSAMDPEQEVQEEMTAFARAILAHAPAEVQHFVYTDHENGEDLEVQAGGDYTVQQELVPLTYTADGGSYYGMSAAQHVQYGAEPDSRVLYSCYLGGSPLNSAPGFLISTALLLG